MNVEKNYTEETLYVTYDPRRQIVHTKKTPDEILDAINSGEDLGGLRSVHFIPSEDLVGDRPKFVIPFNDIFYHSFVDTLTTILRVCELMPTAIFVIFMNTRAQRFNYVSLIFKLLGSHGIDVYVVPNYATDSDGIFDKKFPDEFPVSAIKISNFTYIPTVETPQEFNYMSSLTEIKDALDSVIGFATQGRELNPEKYIYVSRKGAKSRDVPPWADKYAGIKNDIRIQDEEVLEAYLISKGFEIIYPGEIEDFNQQVNLMSRAKVLIASSGSGLINMGFMKDGQTVIDLRVELLHYDEHSPFQEITDMYDPIAFVKGHTYIAVPCPSRRSADIITSLKVLGI